MAWLLWIRGFRSAVPQKVFSGAGDAPFIDAGIKDHVLSQHKLNSEQEDMCLEDLAALYPSPSMTKAEADRLGAPS